MHTHLSGGEPLLRPDLERIVAAAEAAGIYTQLVTSGTGLDEARLAALTGAGLRSVQLSVQHADPGANDRIAGTPPPLRREGTGRGARPPGRDPLGLNVVLHRDNLDAVDAVIELGLAWGADRIELANAQFYGWGLLNRTALLPTRDQLARARETVERRREELAGRIDLVWVVPDYFDGVAKPCMGGWGAVSLTVAPDGTVLPCPAAASLPDLNPPNVRDHRLAWIWQRSPAFNRFRGTDWMTRPLPVLSPPGGGLRRLPLPGVRPHRRRRPHRSGVRALPRPPPRPRAGRRRPARGTAVRLPPARSGTGTGTGTGTDRPHHRRPEGQELTGWTMCSHRLSRPAEQQLVSGSE
ncbi:PqqA peptide cyclase [Streptomyces canarius]